MYKFIYTPCVYISIDHFKSLCGKKTQKTTRSITERETGKQKKKKNFQLTPPAALQINTIKN